MALRLAVAELTSSTASLSRFAASPPTAICTHAIRSFSSAPSIRMSSKRKMQTSTSYTPSSLSQLPPTPPRNANIPASSIAGGIPQVNDTRSPKIPSQPETISISHEKKADIQITEQEAQVSKPVTQVGEAPKPRRMPRARKMAMTLTPNAVSHIKRLLDQPNPKLLKVGTRNRGCSGLAYSLEFVDKPGKFDELVEQDGVKVLVDSKALMTIIGTEMDWQEDKLNQRFVFNNPNIKEQCGCGESFMV